ASRPPPPGSPPSQRHPRAACAADALAAAAMGGAQGARRGGDCPDEELGLQDDVFPWFHLVQWSAEDAKANCVFSWDLARIQESVAALTQDGVAWSGRPVGGELQRVNLDGSWRQRVGTAS
ncbi:unnamed protein product, partial [Prorocentrum cordatum]